jgi:tripartite-type tricarboxylate transporter receptor subunit TctC
LAWARAYPSRPVRIIVIGAAGNTSDVMAHLIGQYLSERCGQPFIIENRPGAGGNIRTRQSYAHRRGSGGCKAGMAVPEPRIVCPA